jgi:acetyltransferase-like isoleucine patch superfamily enzyme
MKDYINDHIMSIQQRLWGSIPVGKKSKGVKIFGAYFRRIIHGIARNWVLLPSWRCSLNRLRGVKIGKNVFMGIDVFIDDADPSLVTIEDDVTIIGRTSIIGHAYYPEHFSKVLNEAGKREGTIIKKGAYIGLGSIILPGIIIGEYSIIGAGSVVNKDIEAYSIAVGVPAKVIKSISPEDIIL